MTAIDKDVPVPPPIPSPGRPAKYPLHLMEVGDSFLVPSPSKYLSCLVSRANKRFAPRRFASRRLEDGGLRVWRIA